MVIRGAVREIALVSGSPAGEAFFEAAWAGGMLRIGRLAAEAPGMGALEAAGSVPFGRGDPAAAAEADLRGFLRLEDLSRLPRLGDLPRPKGGRLAVRGEVSGSPGRLRGRLDLEGAELRFAGESGLPAVGRQRAAPRLARDLGLAQSAAAGGGPRRPALPREPLAGGPAPGGRTPRGAFLHPQRGRNRVVLLLSPRPGPDRDRRFGASPHAAYGSLRRRGGTRGPRLLRHLLPAGAARLGHAGRPVLPLPRPGGLRRRRALRHGHRQRGHLHAAHGGMPPLPAARRRDGAGAPRADGVSAPRRDEERAVVHFSVGMAF